MKKISVQLGTEFYEGSILGEKESRKYHAVSTDNSISIFVCNNRLQDGKMKTGQRAAIFEKCYWLSLSSSKRKILLFTNKNFGNKLVEQYGDYLVDIETMNIEI